MLINSEIDIITKVHVYILTLNIDTITKVHVYILTLNKLL